MKTKYFLYLIYTFLLLVISPHTTYAQRAVTGEDCDFYHFLDSYNIEKGWHWGEEVSSQYMNVTICGCNYEIEFGCSCSSDVMGMYIMHYNEMLPYEETNRVVEEIKSAVMSNSITKSVSPEGEITYTIVCT